GLNFTWYTIDGNYFEYTGSPFSLAGKGEGPHIITWGSTDNASNNGTGNVMTVWMDESEPETEILIGQPKHPIASDECDITSDTEVTFLPADMPIAHNSSINFTWYTIDGVYYLGTSFNLSGYMEGSYVITWGSLDHLGHNETGNIITLWVDDSAPTTNLDIVFPSHPSLSPFDGTNVTSNTPFVLSSIDEPLTHSSGVNFTWYTIDGQYFVGALFNLSGYAEGGYVITLGSQDNLSHNKTSKTLTVWLDDSLPQTELSMGVSRHPPYPYDGCNITSHTQITLSGTDKPDAHNAGINFTWYMIDGDYFIGTSFNLTGYAEGGHVISWGSQDNLTQNESHSITVWLDDSSPQTELIIGPEKHPKDGFDGCNVTPYTNFTLIPGDRPDHGSGLKSTWFTIDGQYFEKMSFTLKNYFEGPHTITWGSLDNLSQNETGNVITVYLDRNPPTVPPLDIDEPRYYISNWIVTESTLFTINSSDQYSGVAFNWYKVDGQYFQGKTFNLSGFGEGEHDLVYGAQDNLSHNKTGNSITVYIDMTPPNSTLEIGEPKYRDEDAHYWNVTGDTLFIIQAADNHVGVDTVWYTIDGLYFENSVFTLSDFGDGMHTIAYGARDRLGNNETGNTTIVIADTHSPETDYEVSGLNFRATETDVLNITSGTTFTLSGNDTYSGLNYTWYTIDGQYFEGIIFNLDGYEDGSHTITWGGVDHTGNNETDNALEVFLDDSPPLTRISVGNPKHGEHASDTLNVTSQTLFSLEAKDNHSGIGVVWYTIDGDYYEGTEFNLSGYGDGLHIITWGALDNLGHNETGKSKSVNLDDTAPHTTLVMGSPKYRGNDQDDWNVSQGTAFSITSNDVASGVSIVWYTIDGIFHKGQNFMLSTQNDGLHIITFGSSDNVGNNRTDSTLIVNLDRTPPVSLLSIGDTFPDPDDRFTTNSSTPVEISADDGIGVGVNFIWFSVDGGSTYQIYETHFTLDLNTTSIIFGAVDLLGMNASGTTVRVIVDDREPIIEDDDDEERKVAERPPVLDMFMDYLLYIIILIIVLIIVGLLLRRGKGKQETVDFQTETGEEKAPMPFQLEEEEEAEREVSKGEAESQNELVTFEGEEGEKGKDKLIEFEEEEEKPKNGNTSVDWE
ncbi:MAG: hypothetical protein JSW28_00755, partial [Thermoplasmata archaeon]